MNALILDTNALIRFLEHGQDYADVFSRFDRLLIPAIVEGEYRVGIDPATNAGRRRARALDLLLTSSAVDRLPVDHKMAMKYAEVFNQLKRQGNPIPQNDIWIAAAAIFLDATLCTNDRHFECVNQLKRIMLD